MLRLGIAVDDQRDERHDSAGREHFGVILGQAGEV